MKAMRNDSIREAVVPGTRPDPQAGAGILGVIAVLGLIFAMVQGAIFYRAKTSARFLSTEKGKILAQQAAEAGVEANIADLGSRKLRIEPHMSEYTTYSGKSIGNSSFTTRITSLGLGTDGDTIQLVSLGKSAGNTQTVRAKMRLKYYLDSTRQVIEANPPELVVTNTTVVEPDTTIDTLVQDPETMPAIETTTAYSACINGSSKTCSVCHIPPGDPANRHVNTISKNAVKTHIGHHGDYVTTDGTCDIYNPREVVTVTMVTRVVSTTQVVDKNVYAFVVDTASRVQILSWK